MSIDQINFRNNTINAFNKFRMFDTTILPGEKVDEFPTYTTENVVGTFLKANSLAGPADDSNDDIIYDMTVPPVFQ
jgi:hypothetical protein